MDDDDYWNTSETKASAFSFDDDVLSPQEILAISQRPYTGQTEESVFSNVNTNNIRAATVPLASLVSPKVLELTVLAQSGKHPTATKQEPEQTVPVSLKRLVLGRSCSLHSHRSMNDKKELLDGAVAIGDGNAILTDSPIAAAPVTEGDVGLDPKPMTLKEDMTIDTAMQERPGRLQAPDPKPMPLKNDMTIDTAMQKRPERLQTPWWTEEIAQLRIACQRARRRYTRARRRRSATDAEKDELYKEYRTATKVFQNAIAESKARHKSTLQEEPNQESEENPDSMVISKPPEPTLTQTPDPTVDTDEKNIPLDL